MKKRVLSLFLVLAMLLSLVTVTTTTATAAEATPSPVTDVPYKTNVTTGTAISTEADLKLLGTAGTYYLTNDITITATSNQNGWAYNANNDTFGVYAIAAGTKFYGNGHTITDGTPTNYMSLFNIGGGAAEVHDLIIKNATVSDSVFAVNDYATVIFDNVDVHCLGMTNDHTNDPATEGSAYTEKNNVIGVFDAVVNLQGGTATTSITIKNCDITGSVGLTGGVWNRGEKLNDYGGFVGLMRTGATVVIENSTNSAEMLNKDVTIGGFVGGVEDGAQLTVTNSVFSSTAALKGGKRVGGFVGQMNTSKDIKFTNCVNYTDIETTNSYTAGFVGELKGGAVTISGCANDGNITAPNGSHGSQGGFIGWANNSGVVTIQNSVNNGNITITGEGNGSDRNLTGYVGGFVGDANTGGAFNITNCINNGNISANAIVGGIAGGISGWGTQLTVSGCTNNGSVTATQGTTISNKLRGFAGGMLGGAGGNNDSVVKFINCTNNGTVASLNEAQATGGILGMNGGFGSGGDELSFQNCVNNGTVSGFANVGGIWGEHDASDLLDISLKDCANYGAVTGTNQVGGLIGRHNYRGSVTITNGKNYGAITASAGTAGGLVGYKGTNKDATDTTSKHTYSGINYGTVSATANLGGIVGEGGGSVPLTLTGCLNVGKLVKTSAGSSVGGLIGYSNCHDLAVENSANIGTIDFSTNNVTNVGRLGGLVGGGNYKIDSVTTSIPANIKNSHAYGKVLGTVTATGAEIIAEANLTASDNTYLYDTATNKNGATKKDVAGAAAELSTLSFGNFYADEADRDSDGVIFERLDPVLRAVQETAADGNGLYNVRFIFAIDDVAFYDRVGFTGYVVQDEADTLWEDTYKCTKVYSEIQAKVGNETQNYTAADFGDYQYLYVVTFTGLSVDSLYEFVITAQAGVGGTDWNSAGATKYSDAKEWYVVYDAGTLDTFE